MKNLKASPLPPAPLDAGRLLDCWTESKGVLLLPKPAIFDTSELLFESLGHHFGDPGVQRDTQWTHWGPDVRFYRFFFEFGEPLGTNFGHIFLIFCDLGWQKGKQFPGPWFWWPRDGNYARMQWLNVLEPMQKPCVLSDFTFSIYSVIQGPRGEI